MSRRHNVWIVGSVALAAILSLSEVAGTTKKEPPWVAKDWTQWSAADCREVLDNSPWVTVVESDSGYLGPILFAKVKLLSALPMRQALLRQIQLDKHYDKMKPQQKQAFDEQHSTDLGSTRNDNFVVEISNYSVWNPNVYDNNDIPYFDRHAEPLRQAMLRLANHTYVMPAQMKVLKNGQFVNECQFMFPRMVNGQPVLDPSDSSLGIDLGESLVIDKKAKQAVQCLFDPSTEECLAKDFTSGLIAKVGTPNYSLPWANFKTSDLMYKGRLEY
jgi:hypothetical protein